MAPRYTWITRAQALTALLGRLSNSDFWDIDGGELDVYLNESLRVWNALTESWNVPFQFTPSLQNVGLPNLSGWQNLGAIAGSPRFRTITNVDLYREIQYHLLEPPTGLAWTGTSQFNLQQLQFALDKRRNAVIQAANCNLWQLPSIPAVPGVNRVDLTDQVLEPQRLRYIPNPPFGIPNTLTREDRQSFDYFQPSWLQESGTPASWSVVAEPPLSFDVDLVPDVAAVYDLIMLQSGPPFNPGGPSLLGLPDDFAWVAKYGAMADLFGRENEATDRQRAAYCQQRFIDGLKIFNKGNWLLDATIQGVSTSTSIIALAQMDQYKPEWEQDTEGDGFNELVVAGVDFFAPYPITTASVTLNLVGNMDVEESDDDFVQVSRDVMDVILDYGQHVAMLKCGGDEFAQTKVLLDNFYAAAAETNSRVAELGLFTDVLRNTGRAQAVQVKRD